MSQQAAGNYPLKRLERSGELKNTLFIYTSDHGESLGEHGLWHKNNLYDVAARVPLVLAGAGLPKNVKNKTQEKTSLSG
ncbi:MAG: sulfatase-like hydrolase/transferase [Bacteroidales bacterium]|nr:sulfatase-like hydrolase/transferase [Bacteroidales bacterium]